MASLATRIRDDTARSNLVIRPIRSPAVSALCFPAASALGFRVGGLSKDGTNSYRNRVSCCMDCNSRKRDLSAPDFLRSLYREGELSRKELTARLAALRALAAGKLRPLFSTGEESRSAPAKP